MDTIFSLSNLLIIPFWLLMILAPRWSWTRRIMASPWIAAPAALLYAVLILPQLSTVLPQLANPTLSAVANLLGQPTGATIGWAHFLAFDLFVGRWAYLDSRELNLSPWLVSLILFTILMVGPLGFLIYLITRSITNRGA